MKLKFISLLLSLFLLMSAFSGVGATPYSDIESDGGLPVCIRINGDYIKSDVLPVIQNGTTFVPVRFISEAFESDVAYHDETRTVYINFNDTEIIIPIDKKDAYIDKTPHALLYPAFIKNGRTMVPLRLISEAFGADVSWNQDYHIAWRNNRKQ